MQIIISKQYSMVKAPHQMLDKSASSNTLIANKRNRNFLVFCAFLLTLLLGSSLVQYASSYLPTYDDLRGYQKAFTRRTFLGKAAVLEVRTLDVLHVPAIRDQDFYCDRSHHRTDVCIAKGDVRVVGGGAHAGGAGGHGGDYNVVLLAEAGQERVEKVRPYTRKWEKNIMMTIDEITMTKKVCMISRRSSISNGFNISSNDQAIGAALHRPADDHWNTNLQHKVKEVARTSQNLKLQKNALQLEMQEVQQKGRSSRRKRKIHKIHRQSVNLQQKPQQLLQEDRSQLARSEQSVPAMTVGAAPSLQRRRHQLIPTCEVQHEVPGILFSTGGYTGNVYHEFNDGLIPLFITAHQYPPGQVVLVVLEYHEWWMTKYAEVVAQISHYALIDLARDKRVHCFPEVTVGLRIHDELAIHADLADHASMQGFQSMLRAAYLPRLRHKKAKITAAIIEPAHHVPLPLAAISKKPKLVIISRSSPRAILNQKQLITLADKIGFSVQVLSPTPSTSMVKVYRALSTCDVMMGVHGAAMTHLLFMRPGATFIQVVPLGTDWAAATYYGEPAEKLGLNYVEYKVTQTESSLSEKYGSDDPVLVNPETVNRKGWWETKRIYLGAQDVRISLAKMGAVLRSAYDRAAVAPQV